MLQWGAVTVAAEPAVASVTFPTPFTTAVYSLPVGTRIANSGGLDDNHNFAQLYGTPTTTGFVVKNQYVGGGNVQIVAHWFAVGK